VTWPRTREAFHYLRNNVVAFTWSSLLTGLFFHAATTAAGLGPQAIGYYLLVFVAFLVSLALAVSFCGYGLIRKRVAASAQTGLFVECLILFPIGLAYVSALMVHGGRVWGLVPKEKLPLYNVFYEARTMARGAAALRDTVDGVPFGDLVFDTKIRKTVRYAEAPVKGTSVLKYDPTGSAAGAYRDLAKEVLNGAKTRQHA